MTKKYAGLSVGNSRFVEIFAKKGIELGHHLTIEEMREIADHCSDSALRKIDLAAIRNFEEYKKLPDISGKPSKTASKLRVDDFEILEAFLNYSNRNGGWPKKFKDIPEYELPCSMGLIRARFGGAREIAQEIINRFPADKIHFDPYPFPWMDREEQMIFVRDLWEESQKRGTRLSKYDIEEIGNRSKYKKMSIRCDYVRANKYLKEMYGEDYLRMPPPKYPRKNLASKESLIQGYIDACLEEGRVIGMSAESIKQSLGKHGVWPNTVQKLFGSVYRLREECAKQDPRFTQLMANYVRSHRRNMHIPHHIVLASKK